MKYLLSLDDAFLQYVNEISAVINTEELESADLRTLTRDDFIRHGITTFSHQTKMLQGIKQLDFSEDVINLDLNPQKETQL